MKDMGQAILMMVFIFINKTIIGLITQWKKAVIHLDEVQDLLVRRDKQAVAAAAVAAAVAVAAVSIVEEAVAVAAAVEISNL